MPSIKEEREESDGDQDEQDTDNSDKTPSTSEMSEGSELEDSSEMDEEECEKRRNQCLQDMIELEKQFAILRESLYQERIAQINLSLEEVHCGRAKEYMEPYEELQENLRIRTEVAGILKKLRVHNIENKFAAEELAAFQNFESEKMILRDSIQSDLEEKIRRLEEDRNNVDINSDLWEQSHMKKKRKCDSASPDKRKKPVTVSGPFIVYMLREADILEDWTAIKKALVAKRKLSLQL